MLIQHYNSLIKAYNDIEVRHRVGVAIIFFGCIILPSFSAYNALKGRSSKKAALKLALFSFIAAYLTNMPPEPNSDNPEIDSILAVLGLFIIYFITALIPLGLFEPLQNEEKAASSSEEKLPSNLTIDGNTRKDLLAYFLEANATNEELENLPENSRTEKLLTLFKTLSETYRCSIDHCLIEAPLLIANSSAHSVLNGLQMVSKTNLINLARAFPHTTITSTRNTDYEDKMLKDIRNFLIDCLLFRIAKAKKILETKESKTLSSDLNVLEAKYGFQILPDGSVRDFLPQKTETRFFSSSHEEKKENEELKQERMLKDLKAFLASYDKAFKNSNNAPETKTPMDISSKKMR